MIFCKYFDDFDENKQEKEVLKEVLINEKYIVYCIENQENKKHTDIKMIDNSIFTTPNSMTEILIANLKLKFADKEHQFKTNDNLETNL